MGLVFIAIGGVLFWRKAKITCKSVANAAGSRGKTRFFPDLFRAPGGVPTGAKWIQPAVPVLPHPAGYLQPGKESFASGGSPPGAKWIQPALVQLFSVASCVCSGKDGSLVQRELSANAD